MASTYDKELVNWILHVYQHCINFYFIDSSNRSKQKSKSWVTAHAHTKQLALRELYEYDSCDDREKEIFTMC